MVSIRRSSGSGRFSALQKMPPGHITRKLRVVRNLGRGFPRAQADFGRRSRWGQFGAACQMRGDRVAPSSAAFSTAPGRFTSENCAVSPCARRQKPDCGNATPGRRNCAGNGVSQHSPVQSFRSDGFRAVSHGASPPARSRRGSRPAGWHRRPPPVSPAFRLALAHSILEIARHSGRGIRRK